MRARVKGEGGSELGGGGAAHKGAPQHFGSSSPPALAALALTLALALALTLT